MGGVGVKLKVVRESNGCAESSIKPIEIPPPRPKRKPMHPYPRKSTDLHKGTPVSSQPGRSPSTNVSVLDKDNQSPTSILSPFASDTLGSAISDQQNGCSSPTSCTTEMQSTNVLIAEKEHEYVTSNSSPEEEKVSILSANPNRGNILSMKTEPQSKESVCIKGNAEPAAAPPCAGIKLFGQTVLVTGSHKPYLSGAESCKSPITDSSEEVLNIDNVNSINIFPSQKLDTRLSLRMVTGSCKPFPSEAPYTEPQKENSIVESCPNASMPCWPIMYQELPFFNIVSDNQNTASAAVDSIVKDRFSEKEMLHERSCTGSSTGSVSGSEKREKNSEAAVDSHCQQSCSPVETSPGNRKKGFLPYKRCLLEEDRKSSIVVSEERERQRARVCS
ncbi:protein REVEILLE 7-like isoform X2 [Mangifera indica]|uniref:protein REVEILLE 7-like isoform X2 n=1 Tax=Mangifera indica TaxID=29780 RepID=UPI001CFA2066|nr:protein REVEILLE 7-like isoform X2 [Mangifera indica]